MRDPRTTAEMLLDHSGFLRELARGLVRGEDAADDLVQETLLVGLEKSPRDPRRAGAWLRTVLRNLFVQQRRSATTRKRHGAALPAREQEPSALDSAAHRAAVQAVADAVCALDEPYYSVIRLRFFEGLPPREIAAREGLAVGTVKRRLERGLAQLRQRLRPHRDDGAWRGLIVPLAALASSGTPSASSSRAWLAASAPKLGLMLVGAGVLVGGILAMAWPEPEPMALAGEGGEAPAGAVPRPRRHSLAEKPGVDRVAAGATAAAPDRERDVFGRVVDDAGAPVAGALVTSLAYPWRRISELSHDEWDEAEVVGRQRTDADGRFRLRHRRGEVVDLRVSAPGLATSGVAGCPAGGEVRIVLRRAVRLVVLATDEAGEPVADVRVRCTPLSVEGRPSPLRPSGRSDAGGRCEIDGLRPGRAMLFLSSPTCGGAVRIVELTPDGAGPVRIVLPPGRTLTGRVVDAVTGRPIGGARVGENWTLEREVTTDEDGRWTLHGWTGRTADDVHVRSSGYGRASRVVGDASNIDFSLTPGDRVTGRLLDAAGRPVRGARVAAVGSLRGERYHVDSETARSSGDGRFSIPGLRRDMPHTLIVQAPGWGRVLFDFGPRRGGPGEVALGDLVLEPASFVEGVVLDEAGRPLAGAAVKLLGHNADRCRRFGVTALVEGRYAGSEVRRTDDIGRFRFPDLAPGSYRVTALRARDDLVEATTRISRPAEVRRVELSYVDRAALALVLVDEDGVPVPAVSGRVSWASAGRLDVLSDREGRIELRGLPPGEEIRIELGGCRIEEQAEIVTRFHDGEKRVVLRRRR